MKSRTLERSETPVLFVSRRDAMPNAAREAFEELEAKIGGSLRGRRFYGVFLPAEDEYCACVEPKARDEATTLGLRSGVLPGGHYVAHILRGEPPELYSRIAATFEALAAARRPDPRRPWIEFYRRRDEIVLLLPFEG